MKRRQAQLHLEPGSGRSHIVVDGHELAGVTGVTVSGSPKTIPRLEVSVVLHEVEIDGEMHVIVPDRTRETLIALGWTAPPGEVVHLIGEGGLTACCGRPPFELPRGDGITVAESTANCAGHRA